MTRGRPTEVSSKLFLETVLPFANRICVDSKIVKNETVYFDISTLLKNKFTASSIYSMITNNKYSVKDEIFKALKIIPNESDQSKDNEALENPFNTSDDIHNENEFTIEEMISWEAFESMQEVREYETCSTRESKCRKRPFRKLISGKYQPFFNEILLAKAKIKCGINYGDCHLTRDGRSGYLKANCRCGTKIWFEFSSVGGYILVVINIAPGSGENCGPSYIRSHEQTIVTAQIKEAGTVDLFLSKKAQQLMPEGGKRPAIVRSSHTYHSMQSKINRRKFLHEDPITALDIMKNSTHANSIHDLGQDTFFVDFYLNIQIHAYKLVRQLYGGVSLYIDATGIKVDKIKRQVSIKEKALLCYVMVAHCDEAQFTVAQRIGERHKTKDLKSFFQDFHDSGALHPREVISDEGRALLNAAVLTYTRFFNIEEYADSLLDLKKDETSKGTRIRIDVAHFLAKYKKLFKDLPRRIFTFYMGALGALVISQDLNEATEIIEALFLIANCETEGLLENGELSQCSVKKTWLKTLITTDECEKIVTENSEIVNKTVDENDDEEDEKKEETKLNQWGVWAFNIYKKVSDSFSVEGADINAHFLQNKNFNKNFLKDLQLLPIWGNIVSPIFDFGRVPASSAPVEGKINKLKNNFMSQYKHPIRVDEFVGDYIDYLQGKARLVNAALQEKIDSSEVALAISNCQICSENIDSEQISKNCSLCNSLIHQNCGSSHEEFLVCSKCLGTNYVQKFLSLNEVENWGGKGRENSKNDLKKKIEKFKKVVDAESSEIVICSVCKNELHSDENHPCVACNKLVHTIEQCSFPLRSNKEDQEKHEGHDEERICHDCFQNIETEFKSQKVMENNPIVLATSNNNKESITERKQKNAVTTNEINATDSEVASNVLKNKVEKINQDKKNLTQTTRKRSSRQVAKYLMARKNDVADSIQWEKNKALAIIKNGNSHNLAPSKIDGKIVSLTNTCAFDSLLYLVLIACSDYLHLINKVKIVQSLFFELVVYVLKSGIKAHTYTLRAEVLTQICGIKDSQLVPGHYTMDCNVSIEWITTKLLIEFPSFIEKAKCNVCGHEKLTNLAIISIKDVEMNSEYISKAIADNFIRVKGTCDKCKKLECVSYNLEEIGDTVCISIMNQNEKNVQYKLSDFPKTIENPLKENHYLDLIGVVAFRGSDKVTMNAGVSNKDIAASAPTGHYTTYAYRRGNTGWMEIDDLATKPRYHQRSHLIVPRLLMYIKRE